MTHRVTLSFEAFGWESLESEAGRHGETLDEWLSRAVTYFEAELRTTRTALRPPRFKPSGQGTRREIQLDLTEDCWDRLVGEAERLGIPTEQLLEHAALFHLADVESGRVANRVPGRAAGKAKRR